MSDRRMCRFPGCGWGGVMGTHYEYNRRERRLVTDSREWIEGAEIDEHEATVAAWMKAYRIRARWARRIASGNLKAVPMRARAALREVA